MSVKLTEYHCVNLAESDSATNGKNESSSPMRLSKVDCLENG